MLNIDSQTIGIAIVVIFIFVLVYIAFKDKLHFGEKSKKTEPVDDLTSKIIALRDQINSI